MSNTSSICFPFSENKTPETFQAESGSPVASGSFMPGGTRETLAGPEAESPQFLK